MVIDAVIIGYCFLFNVLIHLLYIDRDNTNIIMSVFCKGCRKTTINEDFGLKADGIQYNKHVWNVELKQSGK